MPAPHDVLSRLIDAYGNQTAAQGNGQNPTITELRSVNLWLAISTESMVDAEAYIFSKKKISVNR